MQFVAATKINYAANLEIAFTLLAQCNPSPSSRTGNISLDQNTSSSVNPLIATTTSSSNGYQNSTTNKTSSSFKKPSSSSPLVLDSKSATLESFVKLNDNIDFGRVRKMVDELGQLNCVGSFQARFKSLDTQNSMVNNYLGEHDDAEMMDRVTFAHVSQLILLHADVMQTDKSNDQQQPTMMQRYLPELYETKIFLQLTEFVRGSFFQYCFAAILVLNIIALTLETQGQPLYNFTIPITIAFVIIYSIEFFLLLIVNGWTWFYKSMRRRIELFTLIATAILLPIYIFTKVVTEDSSPGKNVRLLRLILVMRCTPTIRLLAYVGDYNTFAKV
jgi:hypothetical protein